MTNKNFTPVDDESLTKCLEALGNADQLKSVLLYLHENPFSLTYEICAGGGTINLPQSVKDLRPVCFRFGVNIVNYLPQKRHTSRFGKKSQLHRWYLERI